MKIFLVISGCLSIIFDIFDLRILMFIFERSTLLKREIQEARFWTFYRTFYFFLNSEVWTFGQNFERPTRISNVRPKFRASEKTVKKYSKNLENRESAICFWKLREIFFVIFCFFSYNI